MKNKIFLAIIALSGVFASCNKDVLNPLPTNAVSDEQIFTDAASAQTALNSAYSLIGSYVSITLGTIMSEVMGEDALMTSGEYGRPTYNWNMYSYTYSQVPAQEPWWFGYSNYIWEVDYKGIDAANCIISYMGDRTNEDGVAQLVAQAYGVRGFLYLRLVHLFAAAYTTNPDGAGLILITEPQNAASEHVGRSSLKATYERIISDLKAAENGLQTTDKAYLTPKAVDLLLARAYLDMGDFANAKTYAEKAADNVFDGSNLMSQDEWRSGFKDHNAEWLWFYDFNAVTSNLYASIPSFYYHADGFTSADEDGWVDPNDQLDESKGINIVDGYGTVRWTRRFKESFEDGDCRKMFPFYFDKKDGFLTNKFSHRSVIGDAEFPMARIAEAYLIKAECEAQVGSAATAKSVLNALQLKRGASATEATLENIYFERRKELYGEGFRLNDIKRTHQALDRTKDPENWATVLQLPADSPRFMLPIPEVEMLYNKALTPNDQNEFWR